MEQNSLVEVSIDEELLDENGHFKDGQSLINFLIQAIEDGKLPEYFKSIIDAIELVQEHKIARFWTVQLFEVWDENKNSHIFKEISQEVQPKDQIERLQYSAKEPRLQKFVYPNKKNRLQFIFPSSYLRFMARGKEHIAVILPKAKGKSLQDIMRIFETNTSPEVIKYLCKAYFDLGFAMAKFYNKQGTLNNTITHGDLHSGNIFYDPEFRLITLIDNDRVNVYIQKSRDISRDLATLFAISPYIINLTFEGFIERIDLEHWYAIAVTSFMFGFLSTYEESERRNIFIKLKDLLLKWDTYFKKEGIEKARVAIENVLIKNSENENSLESQYVEQGKSELEIIEQNPELKVLKYLILSKD